MHRLRMAALFCLFTACGDGDAPLVRPSVPAAGAPNATDVRRARNVIVFMGDGMGPEQLSTGRYAKPAGMHFDQLRGPVYVNTDSLTTQRASEPEGHATDSAAAATAIATGVRVENGVLSLSEEGPLETVLEACQRAGKATGLVTTSFFFDASPAAFAAHAASRDQYDDIVRQILGRVRPEVVMGNGESFDLASGEMREMLRQGDYAVVQDIAGLRAWDPLPGSRLLGLFRTDFVPVAAASELYSMTPALERRDDSPDPTLALMTERALARLSLDPDGFFLFAEDELLDEMGHRGPAEVAWVNRAYPEQVAALDDALGVALDWVERHSSFDETLVVLLADHETGGYHYDRGIGPQSGTFSAYSEGDAYRVGYHTRAPTALYAIGPGSERLHLARDHTGTHRLLIGDLE